jgi:hypothetical protein
MTFSILFRVPGWICGTIGVKEQIVIVGKIFLVVAEKDSYFPDVTRATELILMLEQEVCGGQSVC